MSPRSHLGCRRGREAVRCLGMGNIPYLAITTAAIRVLYSDLTGAQRLVTVEPE